MHGFLSCTLDGHSLTPTPLLAHSHKTNIKQDRRLPLSPYSFLEHCFSQLNLTLDFIAPTSSQCSFFCGSSASTLLLQPTLCSLCRIVVSVICCTNFVYYLLRSHFSPTSAAPVYLFLVCCAKVSRKLGKVNRCEWRQHFRRDETGRDIPP